jgi:hypothetical protein
MPRTIILLGGEAVALRHAARGAAERASPRSTRSSCSSPTITMSRERLHRPRGPARSSSSAGAGCSARPGDPHPAARRGRSTCDDARPRTLGRRAAAPSRSPSALSLNVPPDRHGRADIRPLSRRTRSSQLFKLIRDLRKADGVSVLFVSAPARRSDRDLPTRLHGAPRRAADLDVGRGRGRRYRHRRHHPHDGRPREWAASTHRRTTAGEVALAVEGISRPARARTRARRCFADVSFDVRRGEMLGFAGLVGAGRTEVARAIFGADAGDRRPRSASAMAIRCASPRRRRRCASASAYVLRGPQAARHCRCRSPISA